jgi:hypothetical protein
MVDGSGWEMEYEGRYVVPSLSFLPNLLLNCSLRQGSIALIREFGSLVRSLSPEAL